MWFVHFPPLITDTYSCLKLFTAKGLQILATFPENFSPVPEETFEDILADLMSVITGKSQDVLLWRTALNALVQIGLHLEKIHVSNKKKMGYRKFVVERVVSLLSHEGGTTSLALKLEAILEVAIAGPDCTSTVIDGLEDAIFSKFSEACVCSDAIPSFHSKIMLINPCNSYIQNSPFVFCIGPWKPRGGWGPSFSAWVLFKSGAFPVCCNCKSYIVLHYTSQLHCYANQVLLWIRTNGFEKWTQSDRKSRLFWFINNHHDLRFNMICP